MQSPINEAPAAGLNGYKADIQQGMPRLKVEPDPDPDALEDQFGFQPLTQGVEQQSVPVDPQLEARLSGLAQASETEMPPTKSLEGTVRAASPNAQSSENAPLAFSPPSLGKQEQEAEPLDLSEIVEPQVADDIASEQQFTPPPARPFAMPKGFEDAQPLGAEPAPITDFDPVAELSEQGFADEQTSFEHPVSPREELHNQLAQPDETEYEDAAAVLQNSQDGFSAQTSTDAETQAGAEDVESAEDFPIMTDPISGQPLDALGTVELIERLAKSVRLRAHAGTAAPALAAAMPAAAVEQPSEEENVATAEADPQPFDQPEPTQPAAAAPIQEFGKPLDISAKLESDDFNRGYADDPFVPSALKPIDLGQEDELDDDAVNLSLPLGESAALPEAHSQESDATATAANSENQEPFPPIPQAFNTSESEPAPGPVAFNVSDQGEDEQPFGSLLELRNRLTQPQQFVRVEDEEVDETLAEPAVVFPGQGGQPAPPASPQTTQEPTPQPFAAPEQQQFAPPAQPAVEAPAAQPQDSAPSHDSFGQAPAPFAAQGFTHRPQASDAAQMPAAPTDNEAQAPVAKDPAETERALRSALATLQRMSGAA